jgi:hypothetical protein
MLSPAVDCWFVAKASVTQYGKNLLQRLASVNRGFGTFNNSDTELSVSEFANIVSNHNDKNVEN